MNTGDFFFSNLQDEMQAWTGAGCNIIIIIIIILTVIATSIYEHR